MAKVVTLGEILIRLSPPGYERFKQAISFDINYGGAEANVAASLAQYGDEAAIMSKVPDNAIGDAALAALKKLGVNCDFVVRGGNRMGIYYLENGASVRPSSAVYDRADSSITKALPEEYNFDQIFDGVDLFHVSGITPVLSKEAAELTRATLKAAKERGILVSFDLNYRAKLWTSDIKEKQKIMSEMMSYVDICFGNARDASICLGYKEENIDFINGDYAICVDEEYMKHVAEYYGFTCLITSLRQNHSASDNSYSGAVYTKNGLYQGKTYHLHIVDRVGGGDAFASGCLHGIINQMGYEKALEFGIAASAIKHTIPGDLNYIDEKEVFTLLNSDGSGRVNR